MKTLLLLTLMALPACEYGCGIKFMDACNRACPNGILFVSTGSECVCKP
jgi:hypothetical protein